MRHTGAYRTIVLLLLTLVYAFSFIDRAIINFMSPAIMRDMGFEAWQMGLLKGMAFALFYTLIGLPIAWLADRYNRVNIMIVSLGLWSLFTALTGKAANFTQMGLARIGVGIGEGGGSPPAHSIISDMYPKEKRASALSIYSLGIPFGLMFAYFITGWFAREGVFDWRSLLIKLGIAGIALAVLVKLIVREPERGAQEKTSDQEKTPNQESGTAMASSKTVKAEPFFKSLKTLLSIPTWWAMCMGISAGSFVGYAFSAWQIDYLLPFDTASAHPWGFSRMMYALAIINGLAYGGGTWLGGIVSEHFAKKNVRAYGLVPALTILASMPFAIASFWAPSVMGHMVFISIFVVFLGMYLGPTFSIAQTLAPTNMRAMSTATFFLILNIIALGGGPTTVGFMVSALQKNHSNIEAIRLSITAVCFVFLLSGLSFYIASRTLPRDWKRAQERNENRP